VEGGVINLMTQDDKELGILSELSKKRGVKLKDWLSIFLPWVNHVLGILDLITVGACSCKLLKANSTRRFLVSDKTKAIGQ
jgi:hypothetical protein